MKLTGNDVATLDRASQEYGFDPALIPLLRDALHGQELTHLGVQPGGYFYARTAILEAVARLQARA